MLLVLARWECRLHRLDEHPVGGVAREPLAGGIVEVTCGPGAELSVRAGLEVQVREAPSTRIFRTCATQNAHPRTSAQIAHGK